MGKHVTFYHGEQVDFKYKKTRYELGFSRNNEKVPPYIVMSFYKKGNIIRADFDLKTFRKMVIARSRYLSNGNQQLELFGE